MIQIYSLKFEKLCWTVVLIFRENLLLLEMENPGTGVNWNGGKE